MDFICFTLVAASLINVNYMKYAKASEIQTEVVNVANGAKLLCQNYLYAEPKWYIKDCNENELAPDYKAYNTSALSMAQAMLWINSAESGCDNLKQIGVLQMKFNFTSLEKILLHIKDHAEFSCELPRNNNYTITMHWPGYSNVKKMTMNLLVKSEDLDVCDVNALRCCLTPSVTHYLSDENCFDYGTLTITKVEDCPAKYYDFDFNPKNFYFNDDEKFTIAWNDYTSCSDENYSFILMWTTDDNETCEDNLNKSLSAELSKEEVSSDQQYLVKAVYVNGTVCGTTISAIELPPTLRTEEINHAVGGEDVCTEYPHNLGVILPCSPTCSVYCSCTTRTIEDLENCKFIHSNGYEVYMKEEEDMLCWKYIVSDVKIFYVNESITIFQDDDNLPIAVRTYNQSFSILVLPDSPEVYCGIDKQQRLQLCIVNNHDPDITNYTVVIQINLGYTYESTISKNSVTNCFVSVENTRNIMSPNCGPQILTLTSNNIHGSSEPNSTSFDTNADPDECECFKLNVEVRIEALDITSNSAAFDLSCDSIFTALQDISFNVETKPAIQQNLQLTTMCPNMFQLNDLEPSTDYTIIFEWKSAEDSMSCSVKYEKFFDTNPTNESTSSTTEAVTVDNREINMLLIKVLPAVVGFVIIAVVALIVFGVVVVSCYNYNNN